MLNQRYEGRQKQIEEAALDVFIEQGFDNLTLEAVADKLGYTKQAIYYYFKNKEDLIGSFCLSIIESARDDVVEICTPGKDPGDTLAELIHYYVKGTCLKEGFFALHHDLKQILAKIRNEKRKQEMYSMMEEIPEIITSIITKGVESGMFRREDPEALSGTIFTLLSGVVSLSEVPSLAKLTPDRKVNLITDIILKGIQS